MRPPHPQPQPRPQCQSQPRPSRGAASSPSRARERGSILVLAAVLIVMLAMMGAAFLQMARSDRRSTLQMDTRSQDFNDSILRYILVRVGDDVEFEPIDNDGATASGTTYRHEEYDYPFTWSGQETVIPATGNPTGNDVQSPATELITFPVYEGALRGLEPTNIGARNPANPGPGDYLEPNPLTPEDPNSRVYRAAGLGPFREAFDDELNRAMGAADFNVVADRGQNDDMWLASTAPVFANQLPDGTATYGGYTDANGGNVRAYWPHITNLNGVFLDLTVANLTESSPGAGDFVPRVYLSTANNHLFSGDTYLDLGIMQEEYENLVGFGRFTDADGDGIADSRWTFAPVTGNEGGLTYVMAIRVVDNSALSNLNSHSTYNGFNFTPGEEAFQQPRWYTPGDLNVDAAITNSFAASTATMRNELVRDDGTPPLRAMPEHRFEQRILNWVLTNQLYGNRATRLPDDSPWEFVGTGLQRLAVEGVAGYTGGTIANAAQIAINLPNDPGNVTGPAEIDNAPRLFDDNNEVELRWYNGLNRSSDNQNRDAPVQLERDTSEAFWRQDTAQVIDVETDYSQLNGSTGNSTPTIQQFFEEENRKRFTVTSGSGDFDKLNVNGPSAEGIAEFLRDLNTSRRHLSPTGNDRFGSNFDFIAVADLGTWDDFADAAAAVWADWRDDDIVDGAPDAARPALTQVGDFYGMEYLPFISEVYLKAEYEVNDPPVAGLLMSDGITPAVRVQWEATGDFALAVELLNPWSQPIPIADLELALVDPTTDTPPATNQRIADLRAKLTTALGRSYLEPYEAVLLHIGDIDDVSWPGNVGNVIDLQEPTFVWDERGTAGWTLDNEPRVLTLSAREQANDGEDVTNTQVVYQRFAVPVIPDSTDTRYAATSPTVPAPGSSGIARVGVIGTATGISTMSVRPEDLGIVKHYVNVPADRDPPDNITAAGGTPDRTGVEVVVETTVGNSETDGTSGIGSRFGVYDKNILSADPGRPGGTTLDNSVESVPELFGDVTSTNPQTIAVGDEPFLIGNAGQFYRATDVFRVVFLGPRAGDDGHLAEVMYDVARNTGRYDLRDFMVDVFGDNGTDWVLGNANANDPAHLRTTFPAFLLSRLSTLAPGSDGLDNDGDNRTDDADERLVPGRVNLNTVAITPGVDNDMLERMLPVFFGGSPELVRELISRAVSEGRDMDPNNVNVGLTNGFFNSRNLADDGFGIAAMPHLLDTPLFNLSSPGVAPNITGDFNEYESDLNPTTPIETGRAFDNYDSDREERLAAFGALNQVFDVRSDVYTVYGHVRGYPTGQFNAGPVDDYRFVAVFDRSVVSPTRPLPRLIGYAEFRQN